MAMLITFQRNTLHSELPLQMSAAEISFVSPRYARLRGALYLKARFTGLIAFAGTSAYFAFDIPPDVHRLETVERRAEPEPQLFLGKVPRKIGEVKVCRFATVVGPTSGLTKHRHGI